MRKEYRMPNMGGPTISTRLTVQLMDELRCGAFQDTARLPSEVELAERYGVSRSVIRDVLANLEREGYVERARGVGTVVNRQIVRLNNRLDLKFEYNHLISAAGAVPSTDHVTLYQREADDHVAEQLNVDVNTPLIVCEKRVLASGRPVIYSIDYLPEALFENHDWRAFDWAAPVFDLLWEYSGIAVDASITSLSAVMGPKPVRSSLKVAEDEALILLDEVGTYKLTRSIMYTCCFYTNYFNFTMMRKKF
jgi:GntR family transcriptional regulator